MNFKFMTSGESHGPGMIAVVDGLPAGLELSLPYINNELRRRQVGFGSGPRMKIESDQAVILSGVMEGKTTGAPIAILIQNEDHEKWRGKAVKPFTTPRPGHADLPAAVKFGYRDLRPGLERASARETAARVAVGAICKLLLAEFGIQIGGYVRSIGGIEANLESIGLESRIELAENSPVRCPDKTASKLIEKRIKTIIKEKDTLGGVIEVIALGVPPGLGSFMQWDQRLDARIAKAVLSIQAIKGVEIGEAFDNSKRTGTQVQDQIQLADERLVRTSNRAGGIEGGISNGQPLLVRAAMKPIATTLKPQMTVDLLTKQEVPTQYERSDFCPVPRAVPIVEAMLAITIVEALLEKLGGDSLNELQERFNKLRQTRLSDLDLDGFEHVFWPESQ